MGKQQQFEVLRGVVRRTLLHKFHHTSYVPHPRERPAFEKGRGAVFEFSRHHARNFDALNPKSYSRDPGSLNPSSCPRDSLPRTAIECPPKSAWPLSDSVSLPRIAHPLCSASAAHHCSSSRSSSRDLVEFSPSLGISSGPRRANEIILLAQRSRGFSSLADDPKAAEKVEEVASEAGARDGQGGDDGVSASVSGRDSTVKKRRKSSKSLVQEGDGLAPAVMDSNAARPVLSTNLNGESSENPSTSDNVLPTKQRAARRKRSVDILRAFQTNAEASEALRNEIKALESDEKALEFSVPEQPKPAENLSSAPNGLAKVTKVKKLKIPEDVENGIARRGRADSQSSDVRITSIKTEAFSTSLPTVALDHGDGSQSKLELTSADLPKKESLSSDNGITGIRNNATAAAASNKDDKAQTSPVDAVPAMEVPPEFADPRALYQSLAESRGGRAYFGLEKGKLTNILYRFAASGWVSDQALSLYINSKFFPTAVSRFRKFFMHRSSPDLRSFLVSKGPTTEALRFLFPVFAEFCVHEFQTEINRYRELVNTADMTKPDAWYPFARAMRRKVVYHKGPTNSGKTYSALKKFMEAPSGIYCSPLRLLAMEVFDTVNMQGVYCNMHTGQEKKDVPFANHLACTVEMCYLTRQWDVAVIDEIQMMSDEYRGWAWTRAFLGLQADEIHVCGDPSALPLIRNLCQGTGDDLVEFEYQRFKPLTVAEESLRGDFRNIEAGDCIVAFSRRDIFDIKREVELASKHRCCVVYGALPPETRTQQAKLFNEADNEYTVLVASDAIGMGLNLNIRRVVFFSLDKFDGDSKKPVPPAQVKQIAGRAGRRGSLFSEGVTTAFFSQDLAYLGFSMQQDFEPAKAAGLFPVYEQVELFASQLPNETFAKLLERFSETCRLDGAFFLCRYDNLKRVANMLEKVKGLSLEDRFNFCFAPVNVRDPESMGALYRYATAFSQKIPVHVQMGIIPSVSARDEFELLDLEARHQVLSMYLWLSQHFPGDLFPQKNQAGEMASQIAVLLGQSLVQSSRRWSKRKLFPQYRGRPVMGRPDRQGNSWKDYKEDPSRNFVRA